MESPTTNPGLHSSVLHVEMDIQTLRSIAADILFPTGTNALATSNGDGKKLGPPGKSSSLIFKEIEPAQSSST
ncbi:hypothetical protein [Pseudorhodoferax sp. Leaf267]|uniref:hypothetical protein n=1 Tax=Pseudorhodoferax sp. Leaf267 TaxID=1736316 RepID=UPI0012E313E4|nr:hypothetical protein [Pseudorhodoferax sp. Leaf267]